jgi:hypothetical protein
MLPFEGVALAQADPLVFADSFNREPFGFEHRVEQLDLFASDRLTALARKYADHPEDFFVASSAPSADAEFYSVAHSQFKPYDALGVLDSSAQRILLKRPETYDTGFRNLQQTLFDQFIDPTGGLRPTLKRLDSSIFISSAAAITPFHFDPEVTFFFQIEGAKIYHLYSPTAVHETELEAFYKRGVLNIGQLDLSRRDPACEIVFTLAAGKGLHQPQNTPHWVETRGERSISYAISFETAATRAGGRTRAFNHYLRRAGLHPAALAAQPLQDALKSTVAQAAFSARRATKATLRSTSYALVNVVRRPDR